MRRLDMLRTRLCAVSAVVMAVLSSVGCAHREILDPVDMHYIKVYVDETILNINTGFYREDAEHIPYTYPEKMKVTLNDPVTGAMVAQRFLQHEGEDACGRYFDGHIQCRPGSYMLLARSYGSQATVVANDDSFYDATAYTSPMTVDLLSRIPWKSASDTLRVNMPDHMFVARGSVDLPYRSVVDTLKSGEKPYFVAGSLVDSYYIQLRVKGIQYLSSVSAALGGLSGSASLHDGLKLDNPVQIVFDMDYVDIESDEATIYATFNTFGLISGQSNDSGIILQLVVVTTDGKPRICTIDIADEFKTWNAIEHHWLLLDRMITIPVPDGGSGDGGFTPGVEEWTDVVAPIVI